MRGMKLALFGLLISLIPSASASSIATAGDFEVSFLYPVIVAFVVAVMLWKFFVPRQLSALQVAFEIDDDLYEVHRLTKGIDDAKDLLQQGRVAFGVGLYMMGMMGVLVLIGELVFNADVYFDLNLWLIGLFILIPVLISPWETLNAQLIGKNKLRVGRHTIRTGLRRIITLAVLISSTIATVVYGMNLNDGIITPVWLAAGMLVFMAPTILAYGRIMGASWNMLLLNK